MGTNPKHKTQYANIQLFPEAVLLLEHKDALTLYRAFRKFFRKHREILEQDRHVFVRSRRDTHRLVDDIPMNFQGCKSKLHEYCDRMNYGRAYTIYMGLRRTLGLSLPHNC